MQARISKPPSIYPLHSRQQRNLMQKEQSRSKQKHLSRNNNSNTKLRKRSNKNNKKQKDGPFFTDLFGSARDFTGKKKPHALNSSKANEKKATEGSSNNKFEESTASRQFKLRSIRYDNPNGEYFGSKISIKERKNGRSKKKQRDKGMLQLTKSLQLKIRNLRRMQSVHTSETESLKSEASERELRRLQKMQSLERVTLLEQIIGMEQKIIRNKKRRI